MCAIEIGTLRMEEVVGDQIDKYNGIPNRYKNASFSLSERGMHSSNSVISFSYLHLSLSSEGSNQVTTRYQQKKQNKSKWPFVGLLLL